MKYFKENKNLRISVVILLALVLLMSIGYAAFSTALKINGTGHIKGARWSVHYVEDSLTILDDNTDGYTNITGDSVNSPASINSDLNDISFEVAMNFQTKYEFTIDIINDGSYDALVKTVLLTTTKGSNSAISTYDSIYTDGSVTYQVTYEDGTPVQISDTLSVGETKTLKFRVSYSPVSDSAPTEDTDYKFSASVEYTQSSGLPVGEEVNIPYRITFITNGGSSTVTSKYVNRGDKIGTLPTPTKENLTFIGWYSDEALTNKIDQTYIPTDNMNLYARYGGKYVITVNAADSKFVSADKIYVPYGEPITFPTNTMYGFVIDSWYTDESYTNLIDASSYRPTEDMTVYPKFKFYGSNAFVLINNYKFKLTAINNVLLLKDSLGTGTWEEANAAATSFMSEYDSRLMKLEEFKIFRSFLPNSYLWLLDEVGGDATQHYIALRSNGIEKCINSRVHDIVPVITLPDGSFTISGGSGTDADPYTIALR